VKIRWEYCPRCKCILANVWRADASKDDDGAALAHNSTRPTWYSELEHDGFQFRTARTSEQHDPEEHESVHVAHNQLEFLEAERELEENKAKMKLRHISDRKLLDLKCQVLDECNRARGLCTAPFDYSLSKSNLTMDLDDTMQSCRKTIAQTLQELQREGEEASKTDLEIHEEKSFSMTEGWHEILTKAEAVLQERRLWGCRGRISSTAEEARPPL